VAMAGCSFGSKSGKLSSQRKLKIGYMLKIEEISAIEIMNLGAFCKNSKNLVIKENICNFLI
jgi:hypothetical protein